MRFYSTKDPSKFYSLSEAVLKGLPDDNGLFMPESIPRLNDEFIINLKNYSFTDIAFEVANVFLRDDLSQAVIRKIVEAAINFDAPLIRLDDNKYILELFHGPTLAFKDFGARFMAQLMSYLMHDQQKKITILVATSGDTGSAVANGFFKTAGIDVIILYPSQKVSFLQEKQLTTLGENITALEIQGTFDDCQRMVKSAFLDQDLKSQYNLASANSINIARLIPQTFYYFEAFKQLSNKNDVVFSVPSGNFGNLTAGLIAKKMGLPISHFIASVNSNDVFAKYLASGIYDPHASKQTISNAMDVGNPSNYARILDIYNQNINLIRNDISSYTFNDEQTLAIMKEVYQSNKYILDPHGAVGYLGLSEYQRNNSNTTGVILETAHPAKFIDVVESNPGINVIVPGGLQALSGADKVATVLSNSYEDFKDYLIKRK